MAGLRVLQRFRYDLTERYGAPELLPLIRTLYVDTDPEALADAARDRPQARRAGLRPTDVFAAKLNRASHYLKPRFNGQTLTEGWFDPQLLYKIPRNSVTLGVRLFGRLAFCDHYRLLMAKVQSELEAATAGESPAARPLSAKATAALFSTRTAPPSPSRTACSRATRPSSCSVKTRLEQHHDRARLRIQFYSVRRKA